MAPGIDYSRSVEAAERDQIVELKPFAERAMNAERVHGLLRLALGFASCGCWLHRQSLLHDSCHLAARQKQLKRHGLEAWRISLRANLAA